MLNDVSTLKRCHNCGWAQAYDFGTHERMTPEIAQRDGVAYYRGVQTCGSIWACPPCAAKIRDGRAQEVSGFCAEWERRVGGESYMVTLTFPHDLTMALGPLLQLVSKSFTGLIAGRAWMDLKDQLGCAGQIRSIEITHSTRWSGWHPHAHSVYFFRGALDAPARAAFEVYLDRQWRKLITHTCRDCGERFRVRKRCPHAWPVDDRADPECSCSCRCGGKGYDAPSFRRGVTVERCYRAEKAGEYIAKLQESGRDPGMEMTRSDMKTGAAGHRLPFDILESAGTGEKADLELWREYEQATFRKRAITWSDELNKLRRDWLGPDKTDDDLAAPELDGETVLQVTPDVMCIISCVSGLRVRLLEAWEDRGLPGLEDLAGRHGFQLVTTRAGPPKLYRKRVRDG